MSSLVYPTGQNNDNKGKTSLAKNIFQHWKSLTSAAWSLQIGPSELGGRSELVKHGGKTQYMHTIKQ